MSGHIQNILSISPNRSGIIIRCMRHNFQKSFKYKKIKNTYLNAYCEFEIEYFFVQNSLEISSFKIKYEF